MTRLSKEEWVQKAIERTGTGLPLRLYKICYSIAKRIRNNKDYFLLIVGRVRSGKSTLAVKLGSITDKTFSVEDINLDGNEFLNSLKPNVHFKAKLFDEAQMGLDSKDTMSKLNKVLAKTFAIMGQKNLFVIFCTPSLFRLNKQFVKDRVDSMMYVDRKKEGKQERNYIYWFDRPAISRLISSKHEYYDINLAKKVFKFNASRCWSAQVDREKYERKKLDNMNRFLEDETTPIFKKPKQMLTPREISGLLHCSDKTILNLIKKGTFKSQRFGNRHFIPFEQVNNYLSKLNLENNITTE